MFVLGRALLQADNSEPDIAAIWGIFYSVGQEINENLVDSRLVSHKILMVNACDLHMEMLVFGFGHRLDDGVNTGHHIVEREFLEGQHDFTALNF